MKFEVDRICTACGGTGLYVGMCERDGSAVVCYRCKGSGCEHAVLEYEPFVERRPAKDVTWVLRVNPGICVGVGKNQEFALSDFGGQPIDDWAQGRPFPEGSEMRKFTCPAWFYQSADYKKKPNWKECLPCGSFSSCDSFATKEQCWERFDREQKAKE